MKKIIEKANNKLQQISGLKPIMLPKTMKELLNNDDLFKLLFGCSSSIEYGKKQKDGLLLQPAWKYYQKKAKKEKDPIKYLKSIL